MPILRPEERIGTELAGKYRVETILGQGGMGVVFLGRHLGTEREVAIKLLLPLHERNPKLLERFYTEARAAAAIRHPNIIDVLDVGRTEDGSAYLVLELLRGEPLSSCLARMGRLPPEHALGLLLPILRAVEHAHAGGVLHRDLKPDNLFLSIAGDGSVVPKLLDFGVAKQVHAEGGTPTETGAVLGTPQYMSPEQASAVDPLPEAAEVWSLGVILYEALAGARPFEAGNMPALMIKILNGDREPLLRRAPALPPAIAEAIERALDPDVEARYASVAAFREALLSAVEESGVPLEIPKELAMMLEPRLLGAIDPEATMAGPETKMGGAPMAPSPARSILLVGLGLVLGLAIGLAIGLGVGPAP